MPGKVIVLEFKIPYMEIPRNDNIELRNKVITIYPRRKNRR